ncbi:hypothetical protein NPIL_612781 [Nephila pilipes]|uniref:Uncharacterized protein n=1 Tax=Nephila pilipes TaxID=299642 RepID=A0A8X6N0C9_NEPPI|nr:hypothetical protein NPIL_612781 [Nephila pilipes]
MLSIITLFELQINFFRCSLFVRTYLFSLSVAKNRERKKPFGKRIFSTVFQIIPVTESGSDENSDLSDEEYISEDGCESFSSNECSLFAQSEQNDESS